MKQAIKLEFKLKRYAKAVEHYQELLTYVKSAVTRNYSEKSINNILDFLEKTAEDETARKCREDFYSNTLESFQSTNNERLWLKTNIKLARLWLDQKDYSRLTAKLRELHKACLRKDGTDDPGKGTYLLEIYALEILMYAETRNNKRLKVYLLLCWGVLFPELITRKALYQRALRVKSAVPHPNILGVIRECGGKMHMSEGKYSSTQGASILLNVQLENWKDAQSDFFESFRNYDEAGSLQRIQVLKYLVLTTMLMNSDINPFDSPETKAYQNDPRISAMTEMVDAYQRDDINRYESILQKNQDVTQDPFIAENIEEVTRAIRTKGVLKIVAPYSRFTIQFISEKLRISLIEAQDIVAFLILDKKLNAKIDQTTGTVEIERNTDIERIEAVGQWTSAIDSLWSTVMSDNDSAQREDSGGLPVLSDAPALGSSDMMGKDFTGSQGLKRDKKTKGNTPRKLYTGA